MRRNFAMCLAAAAVTAVGCNMSVVEGSGNVVSETRDVAGFSGVSLSLSGELHITQTGEETLSITADDNLLQHIKTEVRDGSLRIELSRDCPGNRIDPSAQIRYELTVRDLDAIAVGGSGRVIVDSLSSDTMGIAVSGSGDVDIEKLEAEKLDVAISGSGEVSLEGRALVQSIAISGSGGYAAGDLRTRSAAVAISGSGDATVWAEESLDVGLSGSGSVDYYGTPSVDRRISGSGSVRSMGERRTSI